MPIVEQAALVAEGTPAPMPVIAEPAPVVEEPAPVVAEPAPAVEEAAAFAEVPTRVGGPSAPVVEERESAPALAVEPDQIADEIHRLDERDFEDVEHTHAGELSLDTNPFEHHAFATEPAIEEIERSLDQQLADADDEDLGLATGDATGESTAASMAPAPAGEVDEADDPDELDPEAIEEIDDFEILAEADEADEDLLAKRPSHSDFASRLDLGDDDEPDATEAIPLTQARVRSLAEIDTAIGELDPKAISAAHAIAAFDSAFDNSDVVVPREHTPRAPVDPTPNADDLETALEALDVDLDDLAFPHAKTELPRSRLAAPTPAAAPAPARARIPTAAPPPTPAAARSRAPSAAPPAVPRRHPRAASEDGVLIDFDDDE